MIKYCALLSYLGNWKEGLNILDVIRDKSSSHEYYLKNLLILKVIFCAVTATIDKKDI